MALIDVVKCELKEGVLVHKFPTCDLSWGTQLVVYPGQEAFLAKGGKICDRFMEGTYTLETKNIPLLDKLVNLPFGGDTPFQADVWFVSMLKRLDLKWGTETPIQMEDPKYGIIVPVRAYGQYGIRVLNAEKFMRFLVGNMSSDFEVNALQRYFRGVLLTNLTNIIATKIIEEKISFLDISTHLQEISLYAQNRLQGGFAEYGLELLLFNVISINVPDDDASLKEIKKAKNLHAKLQIVGKENYSLERSFDVLDKAAENESGVGASFINAGLGLGTSMNLGKHFSEQISARNENLPPIPQEEVYYLVVNGQSQGPYTRNQIVAMLNKDQQVRGMLAWKPGLNNWQPLISFPEFG